MKKEQPFHGNLRNKLKFATKWLNKQQYLGDPCEPETDLTSG